jgi:hypothetical protein
MVMIVEERKKAKKSQRQTEEDEQNLMQVPSRAGLTREQYTIEILA